MAKKGSKSTRTATAESMATKQREISVSEFFAKNRHLLGFDNPRKALLTTIKEAVDNSLDACEEAGILPDIEVKLEEIVPPPSTSKPGRYRVTITDNGPGIVRKQAENIFGKLLYGSKFHRLKMSRGQQGIGISAAGMYGLMTTGRPMVITTRPNNRKPAHHLELAMDTTKNKPEVTVDIETEDFPETTSGTGTRVAIELEAKYVRGKTSVDAYLEQTAIANPHAEITFIPPEKAGEAPTLESGSKEAKTYERTTELEDRIIFPRAVDELPPETEEIKPHPYGVELGSFLRMLKQTEEKQLAGFFKNAFCRVPPSVVKEVTDAATTKEKTITGQTYVSTIDNAAAERLYRSLQDAKLRSPPTDCLAPIGVRTLLAGLLKGVRAEFYTASTRAPSVYRGNPFQIEAAIAFGGDLPGDETARIIRFANRVPLLYQQSACSAFKAVVDTSWKNYGLSQPRGAAPVGPLVVMIHMASVWVPFTSESKEAIADYDEIRKEMKLALMECGRKLGTYVRKRQKMKREGQRRDIFERYIGEIAKACNAITGEDAQAIYDALQRQAQARTALADVQLDEDGNIVQEEAPSKNGRLDNDDDVIIIDDDPTPPPPRSPAKGRVASDAGQPGKPEKQATEEGATGAEGEDAPGLRQGLVQSSNGSDVEAKPQQKTTKKTAKTKATGSDEPPGAKKKRMRLDPVGGGLFDA
ncbi:MAG: DNA topoisomerase [Phycisphaerae bacterium]|nr:DNA topoisomerase [Phycisphaerae bacterium]